MKVNVYEFKLVREGGREGGGKGGRGGGGEEWRKF